jgi:hypothetical protein
VTLDRQDALGLARCGSFKRGWLRFDVNQDLLDYAWMSNVGNGSHGIAAYCGIA